MMKKAYFGLGCVLGLFHLSARAYTIPTGPENDTVKKVKVIDLGAISLTDDPFVARLDSLMNFSFFGQEQEDVEATEQFLDTEDTETVYSIPDFHDTIYQQRLNRLNAATPFKLDYNPDVRRYIDVYSKHRREQVSRMLGLAEYYFPLFEETLDRYNLPLELKYLAIVESALNPLARSRVGATGLWQFMFSTGKLNGLKVSSYIDERCDPIKSTEAACQYLSQLYGIFGDWNLALAAYNSGPGNVSRAIR
ncbi:MAG: lytic transglycosylase domain-containing protein, partial [Owenweeksia sp.]